MHEDVARVEKGGAELRQEKAGENFFEDTTESSPENEDGSGTGVINAAEKTRVTKERRKS